MFFFKKHKKVKLLAPYCTAVVAAAGSSTRMGKDKLMEPLGGEPVILRTLRALEESPYIHRIIVVTRPELQVEIGVLARENHLDKVTSVILGGKTRLESVYRGVSAVSDKTRLIAVHDGARPLVSPALIERTVKAAARCNAAAPALPLKDTVKRVDEYGKVTETVERADLRAVQTPQVFDADLLKAALFKAIADKAEVTDDCAAYERMGGIVTLVEGEERNLKLTTPADLPVAETYLREGDAP